MDLVVGVRKRKLFDDERLKEDLSNAVQSSDMVGRIKIENRIALNSSPIVENGNRLDKFTLDFVKEKLQKFNKDRRSYGINTGIEIAIDIIDECILEEEK